MMTLPPIYVYTHRVEVGSLCHEAAYKVLVLRKEVQGKEVEGYKEGKGVTVEFA